MKKLLCLLLCIASQLLCVQAQSYCVMSGTDGRVIEEEKMHEAQSVASISKVMTALIALEHGDLQDTWKCSSTIAEAEGSMIYLKEGQRVSLRSLLYGLLLRSGNDAAVEIAQHIAGSEEAFVALMNEKAKQLGMLHTVFRNASGLDEADGGNVSSAYDMALLMRYALKQEAFVTISGSKYYTSEWNYRWKNKNRLLWECPFVIAGKTGFTKQAGRTLVTAAAHEGIQSIVVTLRGEDDFSFHQKKHTQMLEELRPVTILKKGSYRIGGKLLQIKEPLSVSMKKDDTERLRVSTHIDNDVFVVEVQIKKDVQVYEYPLEGRDPS